MENDISSDIEYVIECIQEYMDGNEEYYDVVNVVIQALKEFKRLNIENTLKLKLISLISKLTIFIRCPGLFKDREYQAVLEQYKENLEFYQNAQKQLSQYIKKGIRENHYPDLDMAYILYLHLSFFFRNIVAYFSYIRKLEDNYINGFEAYDTAISKPTIDKETIKSLLPFVEIKKED